MAKLGRRMRWRQIRNSSFVTSQNFTSAVRIRKSEQYSTRCDMMADEQLYRRSELSQSQRCYILSQRGARESLGKGSSVQVMNLTLLQ